jgi:hypothetical protein
MADLAREGGRLEMPKMHLESAERAAQGMSEKLQDVRRWGLHTFALIRLEHAGLQLLAVAPHLLPHDAVDAVGTDDDIASVGRAIVCLNLDNVLLGIHAHDALASKDLVFGLDVFVQCLKEHLTIDEELGVSGPESSVLVQL